MADHIRIINYNWRGQGMSSVFLGGGAGDISLGNTSTEVDWPAATQAETYFAKSPDATPSSNAKRWLGTFVANGQGTTGMLYRRNRYFEPKSGQFTQADPIGIAGGMNVFGFAEGDPVNFSDPFGLCPPKNNDYDDCDTSRPDRDPAIAAQLEKARQRAVSNTWLTLGAISLGRMAFSAGVEIIKGAGAWAETSGALRAALAGKGNFGVGSLTMEQSEVAGRAWVGRGAKLASDGKTLVSADKLRQYRPASFKPNLGRVQANLEWRLKPEGQWQGNAHIDIIMPR